MTYCIRLAESADLSHLLTLIHRKAAFDGCSNSVTATTQKLKDTLFSASPLAYILLAQSSGHKLPIGFASYHFTYSTFLAQPSIWLDDIFIESTYRNQGIGTQFIQQLCQIALQHNCGRIDWTVDASNQTGIRFYQKIGAKLKPEVHLCRLDSNAISSRAKDSYSSIFPALT